MEGRNCQREIQREVWMQGCHVQRPGCKGRDIVHSTCEGIFLTNKDTAQRLLRTEMFMLARVVEDWEVQGQNWSWPLVGVES